MGGAGEGTSVGVHGSSETTLCKSSSSRVVAYARLKIDARRHKTSRAALFYPNTLLSCAPTADELHAHTAGGSLRHAQANGHKNRTSSESSGLSSAKGGAP